MVSLLLLMKAMMRLIERGKSAGPAGEVCSGSLPETAPGAQAVRGGYSRNAPPASSGNGSWDMLFTLTGMVGKIGKNTYSR